MHRNLIRVHRFRSSQLQRKIYLGYTRKLGAVPDRADGTNAKVGQRCLLGQQVFCDEDTQPVINTRIPRRFFFFF